MGFFFCSRRIFFRQTTWPTHQNSLERIAMSAKNGMDFISAAV